MAGADRMTIEEVVRKVLLDEHADVIREAAKAVAAEMMELEVSELIGAERGERRPQDRATHRNGYRARRWDDARRAFQAALEAVPGDGPSMTMAQRVENFQANPPAADWDGSWRLDQK